MIFYVLLPQTSAFVFFLIMSVRLFLLTKKETRFTSVNDLQMKEFIFFTEEKKKNSSLKINDLKH